MSGKKCRIVNRYSLAAIALAVSSVTSAYGQTAYFSFQGNFAAAGNKEDFAFNLARSVASSETLRFQTFARAGGTNAAGDVIAANPAAIDSVLELFDSTNVSRGVNDDQNGGTNRDSLISWTGIQTGGGTPLNPAPMPAGDYRLNQIAFSNAGSGPWAVDLVGPRDAISLSSFSPTGTSTVSSLKFGTSGTGTVEALFAISTPMTITGAMTAAQTGNAFIIMGAGGNLAVNGLTSLKTASRFIQNGGTFTSGGGLVVNGLYAANGGTFNANGNVTVDAGTLAIQNSFTLADNKTVTVKNIGQFNYLTGSSYAIGVGTTLDLQSDGDFLCNSGLNIGSFIDTGTLLVNGSGTSVTTNLTTVSDSYWGITNGTANVTISGSGLATINSDTLHLSDDGLPSSNSTVSINSAGKLVTKNIRIGAGSTGVSSMTVTGVNSSFSQAAGSSVVLGGSGTSSGTLTISSGASFTAETGEMTINQTGVVNNSATFLSKGTLWVNTGGQFNQTGGTVTLNNGMNLAGGKFSHTSGTFTLPANKTVSVYSGGLFEWTGSGTSLTVPNTASGFSISGTGSILRQTHTSLGDSNIFLDNESYVYVSNGGKVEAEYIAVGYGQIMVTGPGSNLDVTHGNTAGFANFIGSTGLGVVTFTTDSEGSFLSATPSTLYVGFIGGTGILNAYSNQGVKVQSLAVGTNGAGSGTVRVRGFLDQTIGTNNLTVGQATGGGNGLISVEEGGNFLSGSGTLTINPTGRLDVIVGTFFADSHMTINSGTIYQPDVNGLVEFGEGLTANSNAQIQVYNHWVAKNAISTIQSGSDMIVNNELTFTRNDFSQFGPNNSMIVDGTGTTLTAGSTTMATKSGSSTLTVRNQAVANLGDLSMANAGASAVSTLNVQSSSFANMKNVTIGTTTSTTTTGTITIDNASVNQSGNYNLTLGTSAGGATGTINLQNGGVFTSGTGTLTINPTGTINISSNGVFTASAPLIVHGGAVNLTSGAVFLQQGFTANSFGQLHLGDHDLNPGYNDSITTGADVFVAGTLRFNNPLFPVRANNQFTIDGTGSSLTAGATFINPLAGTLNPTPGSSIMTVTNQATASLGLLTMGDTSSASIASTSVLNVLGGAQVAATNVAIAGGNLSNTSATITVNGSSSFFSQSGTNSLTVGTTPGGAVGVINVQSNGTFFSGNGTLTINPTGTVNISGGGTFATFSSLLNINAGTINETGGKFEPNSGFSATNAAHVNLTNHSVRRLANYTIGSGSQMVVNGTLNFSISSDANLPVNSVVVQNTSSSLTATQTNLGIQPALGGHAAATSTLTFANNATGNLGDLTMNDNSGVLSQPSTFNLNVQSNAFVTASNITIGNSSKNNSTATITVTGTGSKLWQASVSTLDIGTAAGGSTGALKIFSGGDYKTGALVTSIHPTGSILNDSGSFQGSLLFNDGSFTSNSSSNVSGIVGLGTTTIGGGVTTSTTGVRQNAITIIGGGILKISPNGSSVGVSSTKLLTISSISKLDLRDNDLVVDYTSLGATQYNAIRNQVKSGLVLLGGTGVGIGSTEVDAQTVGGTILAVVDSGDPALGGGFTSISGFTVANPGSSVLVKYTWFGDCNLDGVVDGSDYALIDTGFTSGGSLTGWVFGDVDYNGLVQAGDYALADTGFIAQTGALPEPSVLGLVGLGLLMGFRRKKGGNN